MTWVVENCSGTKNGSNTDFTISQTPVAESMLVVYQGIRLVRVGVTPTPGEAQYSSLSNAVKVGQPPTSAEALWVRYWWNE